MERKPLQERIVENLKLVEKGEPLDMPLSILNGVFKKEYAKETTRLYGKEWRRVNQDRDRANRRRYREEHREEISTKHRRYYEEHKEEINAYNRAYRQKNKLIKQGGNNGI